ncbi:hypothetical protein CAP35_03680 [Chitinophagaceae bacterium IBVUCB1]|nr:hypothetical protein CAP35_03680 [Chitinophagaceae bacterium IBVUCB1]
MKILVISHTEHFVNNDGTILGWGSTIKELDAMANAFGEVIHIACLHNKTAPASSIPYSGKVRFVPIKPFGGKGFINKLSIVVNAIANLRIIRKELKNADVFQFRAPTSIGLYIIPYLTFFSKKNGWYKYAGNWVQKNAPISYRIQKWMLLYWQSRKITINGKWDNQPDKCLSFENPCLTDEGRVVGQQILHERKFNTPFNLCFVGRLDAEKGIYDILEAINQYPDKSIFNRLDIIGDGAEIPNIKKLTERIGITVKIHGALQREDVFEVYKQADFILLPSKSEGFPKVIAEAANFGCIPVVSDVSAISQYINNTNGFLYQHQDKPFTSFFADIPFADTDRLKLIACNAYQMAAPFTYNAYIKKLQQNIID